MSRIRANNYTNKSGTGAPTFTNGVVVTGVTTSTLFDGDLTTTGSVTTFDLDVDGHSELDNLNVSGVSTFVGVVTSTNDIFVGNNLSVAGNARIVGVLTVGSSSITFNGDTNTINVGAGATIHTTTAAFNQLEVAGLSTFIGVSTFIGDTFAKQLTVTNLSVENGSSLGEDIGTRNLIVSGIATVTGATDLNGNLDVDGHTELDNVNISGVTTFVGSGDFNGDIDVDGHTELDNVNISGVTTFQSHTYLGDDDVAYFGAGNDLMIYHSSSDNHSYIHETGTGSLFLRADEIYMRNAASNENKAVLSTDGSVDLYYDNSLKFQTIGAGISVSNGASNTATIAGPANIIIDPGTVGDDTGTVRIKGDLYVDGDSFVVDSTTISLADKVVGIASTATTDTLADGAGIQIGPDNTFLYEHSSTSLKSSENLNVASGKSYKINGTDVLTATTLGTGVVNSSLTSLGAGVINNRTELTVGQPSGNDYLLLYDVSDGGLKKATITNAALQGVQGVQGTQGIQGVQGTQGTQGIQGIQGTYGTQGTQGIQGIQGVQGIQGSTAGNAATVTVAADATNATRYGTFVDSTSGSLAVRADGGFTYNPSSNTLTAGSFTDDAGPLRDIPQNAKTSGYTLVASDAGKHISITTGGVTVPASVFGVGDCVTIYNDSASNQTITQGTSVTLRLAGQTATGNRTLSSYGIATLLCVASNTFVITGVILT
jgi:hypothetical protein